MGLHRRTWPGSTLRLSHSCSVCLLSESWARCARLGINLRFATLHQAQRVSLPIRRLAPRDKAWSKLCLSPPGSACLLVDSQARTARQGLGSCFASLHKPQCVSSPIRGLAPWDKSWVHALFLCTRFSVSPCRVGGSHLRTRCDPMACLSSPGSVCLLAESRARIAGQGLGPRFASLSQAQRVSSPSRSSHRRTRLGSKFCLSPRGSAYLVAESWAQSTGQCLGLRHASLL